MEYIERFIEKDLKDWKASNSSCALEVTGCRQVGKTTTVLHFAHENYDNVIYINPVADRDLVLLEQSNEYNVLKNIQLICENRGISFENKNSTILIIDEIQENKALYERIRLFNRWLNCDVIVTGSYLRKTKDYFQPAGDLEYLRMYPLSYEEYLNYFGLYDYYKEKSIDEICAERLDDFKEIYNVYLKVGGYPSAFNAYLEGRSLNSAFERLVDSFKSEFNVNILRGADIDKIDQMFRVICTMLCREKKGNSHVVTTVSQLTEQENSKRISTRECNDLLAWMSAARLINYCDKIDLVTGELYPSERFYFEDTGLFSYLCELNFIREATVSGVLAETFIYKQLSENNFSRHFYGTRPYFAINESYELDFYVRSRLDNKAYGIEVKSGDSSGISINKMLEKKQIDFAIYAKGDSKTGCVDKKFTLPIFLFNKFVFDKGDIIQKKELPRYNKNSFNKISKLDVFK